MVFILLRPNRTFIDNCFPVIEIIFTLELRLSLCSLVVQGLIGESAHLIFVHNLYGSGPLEDRTAVIVGTVLRGAMIESFIGVFFFFAIERLIATFAWSWYEKASPQTLIVFIVLESSSVISSLTWSTALVFEFMSPLPILIIAACTAIIGGAIFFLTMAVNFRAQSKMKAGARVNKYSVARSFQIRENVIIIKALLKIGVRVMLLNMPVFIIVTCSMIGEIDSTTRMLSQTLFDLAISIYPIMIIACIPFSDAIFERSLKRMAWGHRLFTVFSIFHPFHRKSTRQKVVPSKGDQYFNMLEVSLRGLQSR